MTILGSTFFLKLGRELTLESHDRGSHDERPIICYLHRNYVIYEYAPQVERRKAGDNIKITVVWKRFSIIMFLPVPVMYSLLDIIIYLRFNTLLIIL